MKKEKKKRALSYSKPPHMMSELESDIYLMKEEEGAEDLVWLCTV